MRTILRYMLFLPMLAITVLCAAMFWIALWMVEPES